MSFAPPTDPNQLNGYPARLEIRSPERLDRWRPFVQWIMAIPHLLIGGALGYVSRALSLVSWFVILFTGRLPVGIANFQCMYQRYNARALAYAGFLTVDYPPFAFEMSATEPGDYPPVGLDIRPQLEGRNRVTVLFRLILAIPHFVVLSILASLALLATVIGAFAVLFTGSWPVGIRRFVVGVSRWAVRFEAYFMLLTDEYPPFSLD